MKPSSSIRRVGFLLLAFVALLVLAVIVANYPGRSAWQKCRRELEAKGERLDWRDFVPPPVPDDQNFAKTPLLAPLFDYVRTSEGRLVVRDKEAVERLTYLFDGSGYLGGSWWRGELADFGTWQKLFRGLTNETDIPDWDAYAKKLWEPDVTSSTNLPSRAGASFAYVEPMTGPPLPPLTGLPIGASPVSQRQVLRTNAAIAAWLATPRATSAAADMLALLRQNSAELGELRAALKRPYARFNIRYEQGEPANLPHLATLKKFAFVFREEAQAELADDNPTLALNDVLTGLSLADSIKAEPFQISGLARLAMIQIMIQPVWEGLARGKWNAEQLAILQTRFEQINQVEAMLHVLRGQRAITLKGVEFWWRHSESGTRLQTLVWSFLISGRIRQDQAVIARAIQEYALPPYDPTNRTVDLALGVELSRKAMELTAAESFLPSCVGLVSSFTKPCAKVCRAQAVINLVATACALERFRLARGQYPERLEELAPNFMQRVPCDPVNGQPLNYRRTDDRRFVLYSVGWNGTDDRGQYVLKPSGSVDQEKSDWVWSYPEAK